MIAKLPSPPLSRGINKKSEPPPLLAGWITPYIKPAENEPHDYQSWPTNALHYRREVEDVIMRFRQNLPFRTSVEDGLQAFRIIAAGYESARRKAEISLAC